MTSPASLFLASRKWPVLVPFNGDTHLGVSHKEGTAAFYDQAADRPQLAMGSMDAAWGRASNCDRVPNEQGRVSHRSSRSSEGQTMERSRSCSQRVEQTSSPQSLHTRVGAVNLCRDNILDDQRERNRNRQGPNAITQLRDDPPVFGQLPSKSSMNKTSNSQAHLVPLELKIRLIQWLHEVVHGQMLEPETPKEAEVTSQGLLQLAEDFRKEASSSSRNSEHKAHLRAVAILLENRAFGVSPLQGKETLEEPARSWKPPGMPGGKGMRDDSWKGTPWQCEALHTGSFAEAQIKMQGSLP
eukprot:s2890_g1.t1